MLGAVKTSCCGIFYILLRLFHKMWEGVFCISPAPVEGIALQARSSTIGCNLV